MKHFFPRFTFRDSRFATSGFTLIEILIVVAIIGILASVALVGLNPVQKKGRDARRISDLRQIQTSLELYFTKNGTYPDAQDFPALKTALTDAQIGTNNIPDDPRNAPSNDIHYYYGVSPAFDSYVLGAQLEDHSNPVLKDSLATPTFNVPCSGASGGVYCVQL